LNGTLPEEIKWLNGIETFDVSQNYLSGTIPQGLEELVDSLKTLRLGRNNLEGVIPESLADITSLVELVVRIDMLEEYPFCLQCFVSSPPFFFFFFFSYRTINFQVPFHRFYSD